jgi:antitoxin YefM
VERQPHTPEDALKAVMAGARVVQVVSALLKNGPDRLAQAARLDRWRLRAYSFLYKGGWPMESITYTKARAHLAQTMDEVCENHEPVIITRSGETSVVMLSLADYKSLEETAYLLRSPKNAQRLIEAIAELERGGGTVRELAG